MPEYRLPDEPQGNPVDLKLERRGRQIALVCEQGDMKQSVLLLTRHGTVQLEPLYTSMAKVMGLRESFKATIKIEPE